MDACHSWPFSHSHHTFRCDPAVTSRGVRTPFLPGCHCRASSGCVDVRSFSPRSMARLAQTGQPAPATRDLTTACHSCPLPHTHHTSLWLPGSTCSGVRGSFFSGCHCFAISGNCDARSVCPAMGSFPAQYGHRVPVLVRVYTGLCHSCPCSHCHHTRLLLPLLTVSGVNCPFFSQSHWRSSSARPVLSQN